MKTYKNLKIEENVSFGKLTTMKLGGDAKYLIKIKKLDEINEAIEFAKSENLPIFILGGGSNTIVHDEGFEGVVLKNEIVGFEIIAEDEDSKTFKIGSGENWDKFCQWAVREEGLSGCEAMAMIPGSVGALPVQNVGAYGQETISIFESCEVVDLKTGEHKTLSKEDCKLSYRSSIFREEDLGRYFITSVTLKLSKTQKKIPLYFSVDEYFKTHGIDGENATPLQIMEAVIFLRSEKLPDPKDIPSAGSFFKNVELSKDEAEEFNQKFEQEYGESALIFEENGKYKIPTGWLIDKTGLRGKMINGMRPHDKNALILTNISAKSYEDLASTRSEIQKAVKDKFGFEIEQEPLEI